MADPLPDVDSLFPSQKPDVDTLFPASVERERTRASLGTSPVQDLIFGNADVSPVARIMNHFGQGFKHGWGAEPLGLSNESNEYLKKSGVFNDYVSGHTSLVKSANEALIRPAAAGLDAAWRGTMGAFSGAQEAVAATGKDIEDASGEGTKVQVGDFTATRAPIAKQIGLSRLARDVAALPEAFQGSPHPTGIPVVNLDKARSLGVIGEGEAGWKGTKDITPEPSVIPQAEAAKAERPVENTPVTGEPAPTVPEVSPQDVHSVARTIDPATFTKYDDLQNRQQVFRRWMNELGEEREKQADATAPNRQEIADTIAKINDPDTTPRLKKKYQTRLEDMSEEYNKHMDDALSKDTPDMALIRKRLQENDYAMRDLAPSVGKAYQEARTRVPETIPERTVAEETRTIEPEATAENFAPPQPEQVTAEAPAEQAKPALKPVASDVADKLIAAGRPAEEAQAAAQIVSEYWKTRAERFKGTKGTAEEMYHAESPSIVAGKGVEPSEGTNNKLAVPASSAESIQEKTAQTAWDEFIDARQGKIRNTQIATGFNDFRTRSGASKLRGRSSQNWVDGNVVDVGFVKNLVVAGKNEDGSFRLLAKPNDVGESQLYSFKQHEGLSKDGKVNFLDSVKNIAPQVEEELAQGRQGRIRIREDGQNTITLMKNADASTFIHETGHDWLERLMKDGRDDLAPTDLKADVDAVKKWLGVTEDKIKTSQHEKFARGFERYLMEGTAPSKGLANVFAQFKEWLTKIYETVTRLKSPITDDIRDVFDRLLSSKPEKTVIAPEAELRKNFADKHEALVDAAKPEEAHSAAETVQAERDRAALKLSPEDQNARLEGIAEQAPRREPRGEELDSDGNAPGQQPADGGVNNAPSEVSPRGGKAEKESAGSREVESPHDPLPEPETRLIDKAGNIRLDNLNLPEDVATVLREAADRNENFMAARRGVMSDAQALDLADALGMDASNLNMRKIGEAFNAEEILAARKLLIQSAQTVRDSMAKAASGTDADVMAYGEAKSRHQMIQEQVAGITAEAGRALRAFRSLDGMKEAQELGALLEQSTGKTLYQLRREAQLGMELDTPQKISKFVNDSKRATFKDMVMEFWINALLSGPMTHVKNMIGNFVVALNSVAETAGAAGVGKIRQVIAGGEEGVTIGEAKARAFGLMQGAQDGIIAAKNAFKNEESFTTAQTIEQRKFQSIPSYKVNLFGNEVEIGGKQVRLPGRLLTAEDEFFKAIASRQELNVIAYREASKLGLEGDAFAAKVADIVTNPTDEQMLAAKKNAEYQTFTKALGPAGRAAQNWTNSHVFFKFIVPFLRTPINLLKYAGERSPFGLLSEKVRDNISGKNGVVAKDTQIARLAMGTMLTVAIGKLVAEGMVTGGGPSDPKQRAALMLTGWRPYSIKIGDMYHSYDWADPFSTNMGISADLMEAYKVAGEDDAELSKIGSGLLASISKNIMGKASLRGASDIIQAVTDPDRYGPKYVQNLAGTVVPSVVAQTARAMDPVQRETRTALDSIISRLPFLRERLFPKRDIWGEPIVSEGSLGPDMISPIRISTFNNDPVNKALVDLRVGPSKLDRKIRGVDLTDQQYDDFSRVAGRMAKMRLNAIVGQPGFDNAPDNIQKNLIETTIKTARETARTMIMMQNPSIVKDAMDAKLEKIRGN
jgi:hypothetical protein